MKKHIEEAIKKKDPAELEKALDSFERKIPIGKIPEKEREFLKEARDLQEKLDLQNRILSTINQSF